MKTLAILAASLAPVIGFGQIAVYTFGDLSGNPSRAPLFAEAGVDAGLVGSGVGMTESFGQVRFSSFSVDTAPRSVFENTFYFTQSEPGAVAANDYWTVTVAPEPGKMLNLTGFSVAVARGGGGASQDAGFSLRTNISGFDVLDTPLGIQMNTSGRGFDDLGDGGNTERLIVPLGPDHQKITAPTEFRIYTWSSEVFNGWFNRIDTIEISGSVEVIPEPSVLSLILGASGVLFLAIRRRR